VDISTHRSGRRPSRQVSCRIVVARPPPFPFPLSALPNEPFLAPCSVQSRVNNDLIRRSVRSSPYHQPEFPHRVEMIGQDDDRSDPKGMVRARTVWIAVRSAGPTQIPS